MTAVLTSHSPFKKRHDPEIICVESDSDDEATAPAHATSGQTQVFVNGNPQVENADNVDGDNDTQSWCDDLLDMAEEDPYIDRGPESFSSAEAAVYRAHLRRLGADGFIKEYLTEDRVPLRKLGTAFGLHPDWALEGDETYFFVLGRALVKELNKRQKLAQYNTIDDAVELLQTARDILVITGAGISTSLGIPDFRSKHTGFYSRLQELGYSDPEEVFNIENFDSDPSLFYNLAGEILPVMHMFSPTHAFIRLLQDKGRLRTNYTQNIDNIESYAGIEKTKLIQCHGSWATATCRKCKYRVPGTTIFEDVNAKRVAQCRKCKQALSVPQAKKRKRSPNSSKPRKAWEDDSDDEDEYEIPEPGVMKPDITFFGEKLPDDFFVRLTELDAKVADLVIVIGTSMGVAPVSEIPNYLPQSVPHINISREAIEHINFDIQLLGNCDDIVAELCRRAGWKLDHNAVLKDYSARVEQVDDGGCRWSVIPKVPMLPTPSSQASPGGSQELTFRSSSQRSNSESPMKKPMHVPQIADALALGLLNKYAGEKTVKPYLAAMPRVDKERLKKLRHLLKHNRRTRNDLALLKAEMAKTA